MRGITIAPQHAAPDKVTRSGTTSWRDPADEWMARRRSGADSGGGAQGSFEQARASSRGGGMTRRISQNALNAVNIAEEVVSNLMSLMDALQEVAGGFELAPGSSQRKTIQDAATTLPQQLNRLLDATTGGSSGRDRTSSSSSRRRDSYSRSRPTSVYEEPSAPSARPQYEEQPRYEQQQQQSRGGGDDMDEMELRLRAEKERQERIKRQLDNKGGPPPNFNAMLTQNSRRRTSTSAFDEQPEPTSPVPQQQAMSRQGSERRNSFRRTSSSAQNDEMDELERRLRAEKERQQRIKQQLTDTRGKPPPNFRLMSSQARQQSSSYEEQAPEPQYQEEPQYEPEPEQSYQQRSPSPRRGQADDVDEAEQRMRAEKERQERIKRKALGAFGKPPPNFRLMMAEGEARGGRARSNTQTRPAEASQAQAQAEPAQQRKPRSQSMSGLHWKEALRLKKQQEAEAERRAQQEAEENEASRFEGLPEWKASLLKEREKKKWEAERPQRERAKREAEEREHFNSLPDWKQNLLIKQGKAPKHLL